MNTVSLFQCQHNKYQGWPSCRPDLANIGKTENSTAAHHFNPSDCSSPCQVSPLTCIFSSKLNKYQLFLSYFSLYPSLRDIIWWSGHPTVTPSKKNVNKNPWKITVSSLSSFQHRDCSMECEYTAMLALYRKMHCFVWWSWQKSPSVVKLQTGRVCVSLSDDAVLYPMKLTKSLPLS